MVQAICGAIERGWVCSLYPEHTDAHVYSVRSHRHALAVSDTMRELAAVAGLACWIDQAEFVEEDTGVDPRCVVAIEPKTLRYYARRLGWEAPDA